MKMMLNKEFGLLKDHAWRIVENIESFMQITALNADYKEDDYIDLYKDTLASKLMIEFYLNEIKPLLWDDQDDAPEEESLDDFLGGRG